MIWVFNGSDPADMVSAALVKIKAAGITVDIVGVDNFAAPKRHGTPESDGSTVTGQALAALRWMMH
jgi:hypothetical protein